LHVAGDAPAIEERHGHAEGVHQYPGAARLAVERRQERDAVGLARLGGQRRGARQALIAVGEEVVAAGLGDPAYRAHAGSRRAARVEGATPNSWPGSKSARRSSSLMSA